MKWKYAISLALVSGLCIVIVKECTNSSWNELIIKSLSLVKKSTTDEVPYKEIMKMSSSNPISHDSWTQLLQKYVSDKGEVDYSGFIADSAVFKEYLDLLSSHPPADSWTLNEQLAYWINAYNAFTVKLVCDHYPISSIKDIAGKLPMINSAWDLKFFEIGGESFDLNTIEHDILRKYYDEPLIHFALNCASFSCPRLLNEAYESDKLNDQLISQAKYFVNNRDKNVISNQETGLSAIFDWYQSDFTKELSLVDFIRQYAPQIRTQNRIHYLKYDWSLNET